MHSIEIDAETLAEITKRRLNRRVSEGDVIRESLGLAMELLPHGVDPGYWQSEGVKFALGTRLEHRFRDGRIAEAVVSQRGVEVKGTTYSGLSPAGVAVTGHQLNGWLFWFLRDEDGRLIAADTLRKR